MNYSGRLPKCIRCGMAGILLGGALGHAKAECDAKLLQRSCSALEQLFRQDETGHRHAPTAPINLYPATVTATTSSASGFVPMFNPGEWPRSS